MVNDPDRLNKQLGEGSAFKKGDFAILSPFENDLGKGYGVTFFNKELAGVRPPIAPPAVVIDIGVEGFYGAVEKAGLRTVGEAGKSIPTFLLATIVDPAAFDAAFSGEGEVTRGQLVVLKQGEKGSTAYIGPARQPTARRYVVSKGEVSEAK